MKIKHYLELIYKKNVLAPSVLAIISVLAIYYYYIQRFVVWHPGFLLGVLPLYWLYRYLEPSRVRLVVILSSIYSLIFTIVLMLSAGFYLEYPALHIGRPKLLIVFLGLLIIGYYVFNTFLSRLAQINFIEKAKGSGKKLFFVSWSLIALSWVPYLIAFYPAIMTSDSIDQWLQATGRVGLFNHHPVAHTLLIRFTVFFDNGYPLAYSLFQIIFLSFSMSLIIWWLYEKGLKRQWLYLVLAYFVLHPLNAMYSITIWKDVVFSAFIGLLTLVIAEIMISKGKAAENYWWIAALLIASLGVLFFRNNGLYIILPTTIFLSLGVEKNKIRVALTLIIALVLYFFITGPVFSTYNIKKSSLTESLGIPIQQVARTVVDNGDISNEDQDLISNVMPIASIKSNYTTAGVDPLKFNNNFHIDVINKNKLEYFYLWSRLLRDNPRAYIAAYFDATRGFWDPFIKNWSLAFDIDPNTYGLKQDRPFPTYSYYFEKFINILSWKNPFYLFWSAANLNYITFVFIGFLILKRSYRSLVVVAPIYLNWATLFVATPIATSTRYVYCSFIAFPIVIFVVLYIISSIGSEKEKVVAI